MQLAGEVLLNPFVLPARHPDCDLQLACAVASQLCVDVGEREIPDAVQVIRAVVPVKAVPREKHLRALHPLCQRESTVGHHHTRPRKRIRVLRERLPVDGTRAGMG